MFRLGQFPRAFILHFSLTTLVAMLTWLCAQEARALTAKHGGNSAGQAGIQLDNSANTTIQASTIRRVSFGISINNKAAAAGFVGDSSNTTVTGNTIIGAANINCPECSLEDNQFIRAATAELGLQIRGSFNSAPSRQTATHHNTFNRNSFRAGNCSTCADVNFIADGSGQIDLRRNFKGTNLYTTVRERGTGSNCGDFGHVFFAYPFPCDRNGSQQT